MTKLPDKCWTEFILSIIRVIKVQFNCVGGYIPKLPQKRWYKSLLAAYPLLSIFSVVGDMNDSVWYPLSVVNFKVKGRAFSPTPSKCTCISPSPVQLRTRISAPAPPLSNCACAYRPSCHVNFRLGTRLRELRLRTTEIIGKFCVCVCVCRVWHDSILIVVRWSLFVWA